MSLAPEKSYPNLLTSINLGPIKLRNRATVSAHGMGLGDNSGGVSERLHNYLVARAEGGAAMLGTESAPVHHSSRNRTLDVRLYDDQVLPSLRHLADAVHAAGAKLSITLWHGGHNVSFLEGQSAVAASPIPSMTRETPRALSASEIPELIKSYGYATRICKQAGLDAVEVQTATSYLLGSFLSPAMNHRTDAYGGSFENRLRIVREIFEEVREAAGAEMAVGVRTSTSHHIPFAPIDYTLEESIASMKILSDSGLVDWVSVISGSRWAAHETIPPMTVQRNQLSEESKKFREVISVPIIVAGRIRSPSDAEQMLADGCADVIAMARTWIAEPDWMRKIESGREDRIRPCMSCNQACAGFVFKGQPGGCVLNPSAGREGELPQLVTTDRPKRVAVIGGGPAGMEAARVAAARGHHVVLWEQEHKLGGQMRLAAEAPHRDEMRGALEWWENELRQWQVEIKLGTRVGSSDDVDADEVIWALGAEAGNGSIWRLRPWLRDGIPGGTGLPHGREVLEGQKSLTGSVLIIDEEGGWSALSLAETLIAQDAISAVTVATTESVWGAADLTFTRELAHVSARIKQAGIEVICDVVVEEVVDKSVITRGGNKLGPFSNIVLATGTVSRNYPDGAVAVGDCVAPRGIWAATQDAAKVARAI